VTAHGSAFGTYASPLCFIPSLSLSLLFNNMKPQVEVRRESLFSANRSFIVLSHSHVVWLWRRDVGRGPNPDYAATIPHTIYCFYQMTFAVRASP
jgi:hypothetical protein